MKLGRNLSGVEAIPHSTCSSAPSAGDAFFCLAPAWGECSLEVPSLRSIHLPSRICHFDTGLPHLRSYTIIRQTPSLTSSGFATPVYLRLVWFTLNLLVPTLSECLGCCVTPAFLPSAQQVSTSSGFLFISLLTTPQTQHFTGLAQYRSTTTRLGCRQIYPSKSGS